MSKRKPVAASNELKNVLNWPKLWASESQGQQIEMIKKVLFMTGDCGCARLLNLSLLHLLNSI